ncbi:MAG: mechanosensitive ion channel family protein [Anderseniella sp.]|nr:mechanosensitive ion channel family protein [Anderseniella sp.]
MAQSASTEPEAAAPSLPPEVLRPAIDVAELELRLLPLTKVELKEAAAVWRDIAKARASAVVEASIKLRASQDDVADSLRQKIADLTGQRNDYLDKLQLVVSAWEAKGGDAVLIGDYRAYRSSLVANEVRQSDWRTLLKRFRGWATDRKGGISWLVNIALFVVALIILFIIARIIRRLAGGAINRIPNLSRLLQTFLIVAVYWATIAIGLMVVLTVMGFNISPLIAVVGGASFIMAFALQDTLGNLAAGLMIMINRPFDEGDYVDIAGTSGTVKSMSIVATKVTTPDNQVIVIPNNKVWGNIITNVTTSPTRRIDLVFGIGYGDSIPRAHAALTEVVKAHPLVLGEPEPVVRVHELADSSVNFVVRPWVNTKDYWSVYWDLTQTVKERFDEDGISIPFPQRDIHLHQAVNEIDSKSTGTA